MWNKLRQIARRYSEVSRDARTAGINSSLNDIDNLNISDKEKQQKKQEFGKDLLLSGLGDVGEFISITDDLKSGNYEQMPINIAFAIIPGNINKIRKRLNTLKYESDAARVIYNHIFNTELPLSNLKWNKVPAHLEEPVNDMRMHLWDWDKQKSESALNNIKSLRETYGSELEKYLQQGGKLKS